MIMHNVCKNTHGQCFFTLINDDDDDDDDDS